MHPWHVHPLAASTKATGWVCDGKHAAGGCRGSGGGRGQARYRCQSGCDYDLCQACWQATSARAGAAGASAARAFRSGERVRVRSVPVAEARRLAEGHGGWADSMQNLMGKTSTVERVDSDGDVRVLGKCWNPAMVERA